MTESAPGARWVFAYGLAHLLTDDDADPSVFVTLCNLTVSSTAPVYGVAPSLDLCRLCERRDRRRRAEFEVAPPEFPTTPTTF